MIEVNPDALSIADKYDGEQKEGNVRGPLQGIPFVAKDVGHSDKRLSTVNEISSTNATSL